MKVSELKEALKHIAGRTELLVIPNAETEDGIKLGTGLGYFDYEENELVYLGKITITTDNNED
jgi:hypothetical protein